jgi:hypothetical protein
MTYNPNIPQAGDVISQSQPQILTNFQQLNQVYGDPNPAGDPNSDHFPFDDASANARKHRKVRLPDSSSTPYTPVANEGVVYARTDSDSQTYPFWRRDTLTTDYPLLPIKVFGEFSTNPIALTPNSFGINNVVSAGQGRWQVNFTETFPDTNYSVYVSQNNGATGVPLGFPNYALKTTTSVQVQLIRQDGTGFSALLPNFSIMIARN